MTSPAQQASETPPSPHSTPSTTASPLVSIHSQKDASVEASPDVSFVKDVTNLTNACADDSPSPTPSTSPTSTPPTAFPSQESASPTQTPDASFVKGVTNMTNACDTDKAGDSPSPTPSTPPTSTPPTAFPSQESASPMQTADVSFAKDVINLTSVCDTSVSKNDPPSPTQEMLSNSVRKVLVLDGADGSDTVAASQSTIDKGGMPPLEYPPPSEYPSPSTDDSTPMCDAEPSATTSTSKAPPTEVVEVSSGDEDDDSSSDDDMSDDDNSGESSDSSSDESSSSDDDSDSDSDSDTKAMELCGVCKKVPFKYRCPRCSVRTCSLPCIREHKKSSSCSGERKRSEFVKLKMMTDETMTKDFVFLEEACRFLDNVKRETFRQLGPKSIINKQNNKRKRSQRGRGRGGKNKRRRGRGGRGRGRGGNNSQNSRNDADASSEYNPKEAYTGKSISGGQFFDQNRRQSRGRGRGRGMGGRGRGRGSGKSDRNPYLYHNYKDFIPIDHRPRVGDQSNLFERRGASSSLKSSNSDSPMGASIASSSSKPNGYNATKSAGTGKRQHQGPSTSSRSSSSPSATSSSAPANVAPSSSPPNLATTPTSSNTSFTSHAHRNYSQNSFAPMPMQSAPLQHAAASHARAQSRAQPSFPQMMPNGPPLPHVMGAMPGFPPGPSPMNNPHMPSDGFMPPFNNPSLAPPPQGFAPAERTPIFGFPFQQQHRGGFGGPRW